jgi:hypothetical protein
MKSILDPSFQYTASINTDIRKTFAKARRAERVAAETIRRSAAEARQKSNPIVLHSVGRPQSRPATADNLKSKESA